MGKTAFLYAGQGSQYKGMGKDLYDMFPEFREAFDSADVGFDLRSVCFEDPGGVINQTEYTQPCMVAFACGITVVLRKKGITADYVCGLSLGEYSALHASGVWDAKVTMETAAFRGKAMAEASKDVDTAMYVVTGLDDEKVAEICREAGDKGVVSISNFNCPGQIVISGEKVAVEDAARLAKAAGAKRCLPLPVSGPFHTSLMKPAGDKLDGYFKSIRFEDMRIPVVFNCIGREKTADEDIRDLLVRQVQQPVRMDESLRYLFEHGVDKFIEIGPGKVLSGLVKKTAKKMGIGDFEIKGIESCEDL